MPPKVAKKWSRYLGLECQFNGYTVFLAAINRRKGITFKYLDTERDAYCLNRSYFTPDREGTKAFNDLFDTILIWASSGEIKWNASISPDNTIEVISHHTYRNARPGYCAFS